MSYYDVRNRTVCRTCTGEAGRRDIRGLWTGNHGTQLLDAAKAYEDYLRTGYYASDVPAPTVDTSDSDPCGSLRRKSSLQEVMQNAAIASAAILFSFI